MRRLPSWLAGGPEVSDLAYRVVVAGFGDPPCPPPRRGTLESTVTTGDVIRHVADQLQVDEADVLWALADPVTRRRPRGQPVSEIAELSAAQRALERVTTPEEAKLLYDQLETLSQYARRYLRDHDQQNEIAKVKLQTARKGGKLLAADETLAHGKTASRDARRLPDGMTWSMSSRWQTLAEIPDGEWPSAVSNVLEHQDELTMAAMLRIAKELDREDQRQRNRDLVEQAPRLADLNERFSTVVLDPPWDWGDEGDGNWATAEDYDRWGEDDL